LRKQDHGELQEHRVGVSSLTPDLDILKQLVAVSKQRQPPAEACNQQRLATSRGLQPAEACNQQRLATSRDLRPAEAYDQQCLATNRDRRELT
jgi:negative regulator of replication initiation